MCRAISAWLLGKAGVTLRPGILSVPIRTGLEYPGGAARRLHTSRAGLLCAATGVLRVTAGIVSAQPASYVSQPASWPPQSDTYPSQSGNDSPSEPHSARTTFADETADYGIPPTNTLHLHDFDAPTPTHIEGAQIVSTVELRRMMTSEKPPLLIDVIGGQQSVSLPNATWLRDAGVGRHLDDDVQAWFDLHLSKLTDHDKSRPLVFFCASRMCWLAHNATLRALDLGYTNVYWYRGGRDSWQAAGLPMSPVAPPPIDD